MEEDTENAAREYSGGPPDDPLDGYRDAVRRLDAMGLSPASVRVPAMEAAAAEAARQPW